MDDVTIEQVIGVALRLLATGLVIGCLAAGTLFIPVGLEQGRVWGYGVAVGLLVLAIAYLVVVHMRLWRGYGQILWKVILGSQLRNPRDRTKV